MLLLMLLLVTHLCQAEIVGDSQGRLSAAVTLGCEEQKNTPRRQLLPRATLTQGVSE